MFATRSDRMRPSTLALAVLVLCIAMSVVLSLADAWVRGSFTSDRSVFGITTLITDFRYLFEQGIYAATIFWLGSRFLETRIVLAVGFDAKDSDGLLVRGPDEDSVVWVGRRYRSRLEAEAVVAAMEERLRRTLP